MAERESIFLWIEPLNRYETNLINTMEEGRRLIQHLGSRTLGLLPDTFHMNIEEMSIEETLQESMSFIHHVHVADSNRRAPGCGHINFKSVLRILKKSGYKGFLSFEILPEPNPNKAARMAIDFLRKKLTR
jgi:sugar phosphate isomerase/epimerase